jgi:hypothetical protein
LQKNTLSADEGNMLNEPTQKVKAWFEAQPVAVTATGQRGTATSRRNMPPVSLQWDKANYFADERAYVVPAAVQTGGSEAYAYLVITTDTQGNPQQAGYTIALPNKKQMSAAQISGINAVPGFLQGRQVPASFTGALLQYSSDGYGYSNACFAGGQAKAGEAAGLIAKKATAGNRAPCTGETVCTDWYWQTWVDGNLIDEEFLFTTCACDGGAGGGGMGDDVNPLVTQFYNYIQSTSSPVTASAPTTTGGADPISFTHTWVVTKGSIANWYVYATTRMDYYHTKLYNSQTGVFDHIYDIVYLNTPSTYYAGSQTFVTTTWTQTAVTNDILSNNTIYAKGVSTVYGTLKHKANFTVPNPLGGTLPTLQSEDVVPGVPCTTLPR